MSPLGVWPLEGDPLELPTSVGYNHPEDWVGMVNAVYTANNLYNTINVSVLLIIQLVYKNSFRIIQGLGMASRNSIETSNSNSTP